jgi:predicted RNA binding protein YcfA (HicA-like mRNA interferase family)
MIAVEKLVQKILNNQKDVNINELVKFMEYYGFTWRIGSKGHYIFTKGNKRVGVAVDHPSKRVKEFYVKDCIKIAQE